MVTSLLWLATAFWPVPPELPVAIFGLGVAMLAAMAVFVIAFVTLARHTIRAEASEILGHARGGPLGGEPAAAAGRG